MGIETWSTVYCNHCHVSTGTRGDTPGEARAQAKRLGWGKRIVYGCYVDGRFHKGYQADYCPRCLIKRGEDE